MLLRAARSPCWRAPGRFLPPAYTVPRSTPWTTAYHGTQLRVFTSHRAWRKQETGNTPLEQKQANLKPAPAARLANDAAQKQKDSKNATTTKKNDLLSEATVGSKEQRKADWAIMREMAKYLWPKVCIREASGLIPLAN